MRRPLFAPILTAVTALAMLFGIAGTASAALAEDYFLDGYQTEVEGTGAATADTDVDRDLNFRASADAVGGTKPLIPILNLFPQSSQTSATARTLASGSAVGVDGPGRYLATVTISGVTTDVAESGNGQARTEAFAQVTYQTGLESFAVAGQGSVEPTEDGTVVIEFEFEVPEDVLPGIQIELRAFAAATGNGSAASSEISGQLTDVTITPVD